MGLASRTRPRRLTRLAASRRYLAWQAWHRTFTMATTVKSKSRFVSCSSLPPAQNKTKHNTTKRYVCLSIFLFVGAIGWSQHSTWTNWNEQTKRGWLLVLTFVIGFLCFFQKIKRMGGEETFIEWRDLWVPVFVALYKWSVSKENEPALSTAASLWQTTVAPCWIDYSKTKTQHARI